MNDVFGFGREMGRAADGGAGGGGDPLFRKEAGQAERTEAHAATGEKLTT